MKGQYQRSIGRECRHSNDDHICHAIGDYFLLIFSSNSNTDIPQEQRSLADIANSAILFPTEENYQKVTPFFVQQGNLISKPQENTEGEKGLMELS